MKNTAAQLNKKEIDALNKRYQQRITVVKQGKNAYIKNDFANAIVHYRNYLKIIAQTKQKTEVELVPELFNSQREISELLLISQVYWDLLKVYDLAPNFEKEFKRSLNKFIIFTKGLPFQVVNAELLRKYINKGKTRHLNDLKAAQKKIGVAAKKCYVATHAFGAEHSVTNELRHFRDRVIFYSLPQWLIIQYYKYSPSFVDFCQKHPVFDKIITSFLLRPLILVFSKLIKLS